MSDEDQVRRRALNMLEPGDRLWLQLKWPILCCACILVIAHIAG